MAAKHVIGTKRVALAYKQYLKGVPLEKIEETDQVKLIIKDFEKHSMFSAYEISQKSQLVNSDIAAELRKIRKNFRRTEKIQGVGTVEMAVMGKLNNVSDKELQKRGVRAASLWRAKQLISLAKKGRSPAEIAAVLDWGEGRVRKTLESAGIKIKA